ncbi:hypothetical protein IM697_07085 [Streptomyces ferrugineus]|uniref:Uncharacterized protein n=2 Tax=Streptomyces ferrugineus TaxID=1413221 RepID=A0A7M2SP77_9ACTN|nr:hypothetical protein [Streptomyces ferrugineus]QOV38150.1 hypothetical protein IM697_07085 [Streptomyces ferrugineus]
METSQSIVPRTPSTTAGHAPTAECSRPPGRCCDPETGCDVVTVPTRQGLEAVDILRRGAGEAVGPVLHDDGCDTLGFVVPPGTAAAWDVPGSTCTETDGRGLNLNPEPPVEGSDWLLPPGEAELATDPAVLRAALGEAARLIEAADNCR